MKIEVKDSEVIIPNSLSKEIYDFLNTVNVPFTEKEKLVTGLRMAVTDTVERFKTKQ